MRTKVALNNVACIEILKQLNKMDIYLVLYTMLVEQELRIKNLPRVYIPAVTKDVFISAFE